MRKVPDEPTRFRDLPPDEDLVGVSELVREAEALPDLAPASRQRIRNRLQRSLARASGRSPRWRLGLRPAIVVVVALLGAGVGGAAVQSMIAERRRAAADRESPVPATAAGGQPRRRSRARQAPIEQPTPSDLPAPDESASPAEVPPPAAAPVPPASLPSGGPPAPIPPVASAGSTGRIASLPLSRDAGPHPQTRRRAADPRPAAPLALALPAESPTLAPQPFTPPPWPRDSAAAPRPEAALLADAIRKLRTDGDPDAALASLDERGARFPNGPLTLEASAIRVEALLKARRPWAALAELDRLPLDAVPSPDDWRVLRGELRGMAGRWREAETDFSAALSGRLRDAVGDFAERALWGRAVARARLDDATGARGDYDRYLARFPTGRFAAEAVRARRPPSPPEPRTP